MSCVHTFLSTDFAGFWLVGLELLPQDCEVGLVGRQSQHNEVSVCAVRPSRNCVIIAPKWGVPSGNHMNDDVAEVNGSAPPNVARLFPPQELGYEARELVLSKTAQTTPTGVLY